MNNYSYEQPPMQPNGMPFSKDDYLAFSKEYQAERKALVKKYNTLQIVLILIGVLCAGVFIPVMITASPGAGIVFLIAGLTLMAVGASFKPKGDRKLIELQEKYYTDYIRSFKN